MSWPWQALSASNANWAGTVPRASPARAALRSMQSCSTAAGVTKDLTPEAKETVCSPLGHLSVMSLISMQRFSSTAAAAPLACVAPTSQADPSPSGTRFRDSDQRQRLASARLAWPRRPIRVLRVAQPLPSIPGPGSPARGGPRAVVVQPPRVPAAVRQPRQSRLPRPEPAVPPPVSERSRRAAPSMRRFASSRRRSVRPSPHSPHTCCAPQSPFPSAAVGAGLPGSGLTLMRGNRTGNDVLFTCPKALYMLTGFYMLQCVALHALRVAELKLVTCSMARSGSGAKE